MISLIEVNHCKVHSHVNLFNILFVYLPSLFHVKCILIMIKMLINHSLHYLLSLFICASSFNRYVYSPVHIVMDNLESHGIV